jgi:hypothetical protein
MSADWIGENTYYTKILVYSRKLQQQLSFSRFLKQWNIKAGLIGQCARTSKLLCPLAEVIKRSQILFFCGQQ